MCHGENILICWSFCAEELAPAVFACLESQERELIGCDGSAKKYLSNCPPGLIAMAA